MQLGRILGNAFDDGEGGPGGWWIVMEPELDLNGPHMVPDLGGWRRERMPEYPDTSGCDVPPDCVCEVLSPSTAGVDRDKKLPIYAKAGVEWVWILDPVEQTLEVKHIAKGRYTDAERHVGGEKVRLEPFAEIEIDLSIIWGSSPPL